MGKNGLKLFISYSHEDNLNEKPYIEEFKKQLSPLKNDDLIEDWYDREIFPGKDFQNEIDNKLENADIICLFISENFLSSVNCLNEKNKALELKENGGISVIPVILSYCGWQRDPDISKLLALPTDGRPVLDFENTNKGFFDVYTGLSKLIEKENKIRQLKINNRFETFLQDTEILLKAHSQKERVLLDDIFVYPDLDKFDSLKDYEDTINSEEILKNILDYPRIVLTGEDQSGKTSLCKLIFKELVNNNFVPVYLNNEKTNFKKDIKNTISDSFSQQYEGDDINDIDIDRIVPIIDDFHFAKNKEKIKLELSIYSRCVLVVDDIFGLDIEEEKFIGSFSRFKIKEFNASLRNEIIEKWVNLNDKEIPDIDYRVNIDKKTELINNTLGKVGKTIGRGIMPSYPFFILSVIFTSETFMGLNQEITSQGYFYQAFIIFYLSKEGVENEEIDMYLNFLTEFAFHIYKENKYELSFHDFKSFIKSYSDRFNFTIPQKTLRKKLRFIISVDSFNNYSFHYPYIYYFFVAKYLADYIDKPEIFGEIRKIMKNLHVNENAYIAVFLAHHSKNIKILEEIENNALELFNGLDPVTLKKDEVKFFDEQIDDIVDAALLPAHVTAERERKKRLQKIDEIEESTKDKEQEENKDEINSTNIEIRRAIKTVEVMGCIIKTRAGSLEKMNLEKLFEEAMNVHLRILSSIFEIIKNEDEQKIMIGFISEILKKINEDRFKENKRKLSAIELENEARIIFWNINFILVFSIIIKIVHSLGSDKLIKIVNKVCDEVNTPASFMVKHGILMWHLKIYKLMKLRNGLKKGIFLK